MRILSWNIAGNDLSAQTPIGWTLASKEDLIIETILKEQPDIITLQEVVGYDIMIQLQGAGYSVLPSSDAHIGKIYVFLRSDPDLQLLKVYKLGPSVMAIIKPTNSPPFGFLGCHLLPFSENAESRRDMLTQMIRELKTRVTRFIIAGDMNIREEETDYILTNLDVKDTFLSLGQPEHFKFSWNGFINPFHQGKNNRAFTCRFDRIFSHRINIQTFKFCGDEPVSKNHNHYLSDHFGLVSDFEI